LLPLAERGATPKVPPVRRKALGAMRALFSPLLPDDYIEMINPLWSTQELRGRIERIQSQAGNAATIEIRPGYEWEGHAPGQFIRIGVVVDGVFHWRAYSLTSDPDDPSGCVSVTPKLVEGGKVTPYLLSEARPGEVLRLGGVEGDFILPDPVPESMLFITAGSGVTPIMSMLRHLDRQDEIRDIVHLHSAPTMDDVIFGDRLGDLDDRHPGYRLHVQVTSEQGRMKPGDLDRLCPDWQEREAFASGPGDMLDALADHWERTGDPEHLLMERFQPKLGEWEDGEGGTIKFTESEVEAESDGSKPILVAGEEAGLDLPFGCREGICHTCIGKLCTGRIRDLRNGKIVGQEGEMVRTCINAPEGPIEIAL
jgi:ferredoxin-NADP reductase